MKPTRLIPQIAPLLICRSSSPAQRKMLARATKRKASCPSQQPAGLRPGALRAFAAQLARAKVPSDCEVINAATRRLKADICFSEDCGFTSLGTADSFVNTKSTGTHSHHPQAVQACMGRPDDCSECPWLTAEALRRSSSVDQVQRHEEYQE